MRHRRALALLLAAGMLCSGCSTGAISSNYRGHISRRCLTMAIHSEMPGY